MYSHIDKAKTLEILLKRDVNKGIYSLQDLPPPKSLAHIFEGAKIVAQCINNNQEVLVVGDYDADGVCASAIMIRFFKALGYANMRLIIPHRFKDGYGITAGLLEKYAHNAAVVVSVDNGITALGAAQWCKNAHIPLVITDHHTPTNELPCADVIIDPYLPECTFPQKAICGAVVAWYFCAALKQTLQTKIDMGMFLEYLAIACIADVMPLVGINRILVQKGVAKLNNSFSNPLSQLIRLKYKHINTQTLAFYLIPLLNCAGRMASANMALELLLCDDFKKAQEIYDKLFVLNQKRKDTQHRILESAKKNLIEAQHIAVAYQEGWHEGVLGIVASNLTKIHSKSTFVFNEESGILKGSARSYNGANLIASITPLSEHLLRFGGHRGAVGLVLEKGQLGDFITRLDRGIIFEEKGEDDVLGIIHSTDIDCELMEICERFEPFGEGNATPIFICEKLSIQSIKCLGKDNRHFEYVLCDMDRKKNIIGVEFFAPMVREIGQCGDVYFELMRDEFRKSIKIKILNFVFPEIP